MDGDVPVQGAGVGPEGLWMVRSNVSLIMVTWDPPCGQNDWQADMTENITFLQIRWWVVMNILLRQDNFIERK